MMSNVAWLQWPSIRAAEDEVVVLPRVAGLERHRLNRGGNRKLNSVIYRIALTQAHFHPDAKAYLERRVSEGKTRREAHRCLRRYIARAI